MPWWLVLRWGQRDDGRAGGGARVARVFVGAVLDQKHPCGDVAVLLASELFGTSVRLSDSGLPGETGHGRD